MNRPRSSSPLWNVVPIFLLILLASVILFRIGSTSAVEPVQQTTVNKGNTADVSDPFDSPTDTPSLLCPVCGYAFLDSVVSNYGIRIDPFDANNTEHHDGLDLAAPEGTPVLAVRDGIVITARIANTGYGNVIILDHGEGVTSVYAHCDKLFVEEGDSVLQGQVIASVGMTGNATGPHLHFELRQNDIPQDPLDF